MVCLGVSTRRRIILLKKAGHSVVDLRNCLSEENIAISLQALVNLVKKYNETGKLLYLPRRTRLRKLTGEMIAMLDQGLSEDDELTVRRARSLLLEKWSNLQVFLPTIKCVLKELGWVCTRPHYCQLLHDVCRLMCCGHLYIATPSGCLVSGPPPTSNYNNYKFHHY